MILWITETIVESKPEAQMVVLTSMMLTTKDLLLAWLQLEFNLFITITVITFLLLTLLLLPQKPSLLELLLSMMPTKSLKEDLLDLDS